MEKSLVHESSPIDQLYLFILISLFMSIIFGVFYGIICNYIHIPLLFPAGLGFITGLVFSKIIHQYKVWFPKLIIIIGICLGIVIFGVSRFSSYLITYPKIVDAISENLKDQGYSYDTNFAKQYFDAALIKKTGQSGFIGYELLSAQLGSTYSSLFSSDDSGITMGPLLTWISWFVELAIIAFFVTVFGFSESRKKHCFLCNDWMNPPQNLGKFSLAETEKVLDFLHQNDFFKLGMMLDNEAPLPNLHLSLQFCSKCNSEKWLILEKFQANSKGQVTSKQIEITNISLNQKNELTEGISNKLKMNKEEPLVL
jgi:hypothetical protein